MEQKSNLHKIAEALKGSVIHAQAKKLYPNDEKAQKAYIIGYEVCNRKWQNGPKDISIQTEELSHEFTKKVNNWFADNVPMWGNILINNLWHYYLALHFYTLGKTEKEEYRKKYVNLINCIDLLSHTALTADQHKLINSILELSNELKIL